MSVPLRRACAGLAFLFAVAAVCTGAASATTNVYLQVPTITGSVTTKGYTGWIQLLLYSFNETFSGGSFHPMPTTSVLTFKKPVDSTSPAFANAYFKGTVLSGSTKLNPVTITGSGGASAALQIEFWNATVVADSSAGAGSGNLDETISLAFTAIKYCYQAKGSHQQLCAMWDFTKNSPTYPGT